MNRSSNSAFAPTEKKLGLYPVVDSIEWIERLLKIGVTTIQLRIKDKQPKDVEQDIITAIKLGREYNARLFINDYCNSPLNITPMVFILDKKISTLPILMLLNSQVYALVFPPIMTLNYKEQKGYFPLILL